MLLLLTLACTTADLDDTAELLTFEHMCGVDQAEDQTYLVTFPVRLEPAELSEWGLLVYWSEEFRTDGRVTFSREITLDNLGQPTAYCTAQDGVFWQEMVVLTEL